MNYYEYFYKTLRKHPDMGAQQIFSSLSCAIADSAFTTKQDLIDLVRAYDEYREEQRNERINATVSAS